MTINEQRFNVVAKEGMDKYEKALEAKSPQNKIKHATAAIKEMKTAIQLAEIIGKKDKIAYLEEYIVLSESLIAEMEYENKKLKEAIEGFNRALEHNQKTLMNQETWIRELYITDKLMRIAKMQENWSAADNFAIRIYEAAKRVLDVPKRIDYLNRIKNVFIESKNLDWINKTYEEMLKTLKKVDGDVKKTKAAVYCDYGKYLHVVLKKEKKAKELVEEAVAIYNEFAMEPEKTAALELLNSFKNK
jgi:tetratricopeptide (TPR) repeat protein